MKPRQVVGLIGANIQQSLSPALHEDAFAAAGIKGHYHLMDLDVLAPLATLAGLLEAARLAGFAGVNITHPCKEQVVGLLDLVSDEARQIGAVNTVVIDASGRTAGHNTDRTGFRHAFEAALGRDAAVDRVVLLIGAGGAGRAAAWALLDLGVAELRVFDREATRAKKLAAEIAHRAHCRAVDDPNLAADGAAGIVNATPVGMSGHPGTPIPVEAIKPSHWVADVIYTPLETALIAAARARSCRVMTGGGMCVRQAAEAFRLFTGIQVDMVRMQALFDRLSAARGRSADSPRPQSR